MMVASSGEYGPHAPVLTSALQEVLEDSLTHIAKANYGGLVLARTDEPQPLSIEEVEEGEIVNLGPAPEFSDDAASLRVQLLHYMETLASEHSSFLFLFLFILSFLLSLNRRCWDRRPSGLLSEQCTLHRKGSTPSRQVRSPNPAWPSLVRTRQRSLCPQEGHSGIAHRHSKREGGI